MNFLHDMALKLLLVLAILSPLIVLIYLQRRKLNRMTPEQRRQERIQYARWRYGDAAVNRALRAFPEYYK